MHISKLSKSAQSNLASHSEAFRLLTSAIAASEALRSWGFAVEYSPNTKENSRKVLVRNSGCGAVFLTGFSSKLREKGCTFVDARTFKDGRGIKYRLEWEKETIARDTKLVIRVIH